MTLRIGFFGLICLILLVLKLCGLSDVDWWIIVVFGIIEMLD